MGLAAVRTGVQARCRVCRGGVRKGKRGGHGGIAGLRFGRLGRRGGVAAFFRLSQKAGKGQRQRGGVFIGRRPSERQRQGVVLDGHFADGLRVFRDGAHVVVGDGFVLAFVVEGEDEEVLFGVELVEQVAAVVGGPCVVNDFEAFALDQ